MNNHEKSTIPKQNPNRVKLIANRLSIDDFHQQWIDAFFEKMYQDIHKKQRVYSLITYIEKKGLTYEQVKEWATLKEWRSVLLEEARSACLSHAENAAIRKDILHEDYTKYVYEIDDKEAKELKEYEILNGNRKTRKKLKEELKKKIEVNSSKSIPIIMAISKD